ncbi:unnamed protein product, partial [Didymodactylos carnosus]
MCEEFNGKFYPDNRTTVYSNIMIARGSEKTTESPPDIKEYLVDSYFPTSGTCAGGQDIMIYLGSPIVDENNFVLYFLTPDGFWMPIQTNIKDKKLIIFKSPQYASISSPKSVDILLTENGNVVKTLTYTFNPLCYVCQSFYAEPSVLPNFDHIDGVGERKVPEHAQ